jgi:phosphoenolpyruvate carboxykinase (ATP)
MPIKATRALLNAALDGSLNTAIFRKDPYFGFEVPIAVPGVDVDILNPRDTWSDKDAYDATGRETGEPVQRQFRQVPAARRAERP